MRSLYRNSLILAVLVIVIFALFYIFDDNKGTAVPPTITKKLNTHNPPVLAAPAPTAPIPPVTRSVLTAPIQPIKQSSPAVSAPVTRSAPAAPIPPIKQSSPVVSAPVARSAPAAPIPPIKQSSPAAPIPPVKRSAPAAPIAMPVINLLKAAPLIVIKPPKPQPVHIVSQSPSAIINKIKTIKTTVNKKLVLSDLISAKAAATNLMNNVSLLCSLIGLMPPITLSSVIQSGGNGPNPYPGSDADKFYHLGGIITAVSLACGSGGSGGSGSGTATCAVQKFAMKASKAYQTTQKINTLTAGLSKHYLGQTFYQGNAFTANPCTAANSCGGFITDIGSIITADTLHTADIWELITKITNAIPEFTKVMNLLTLLLNNTAWITQLPANGFLINNDYSKGDMCASCPNASTANLSAWYPGFEATIQKYITDFKLLIGNLQKITDNIGLATNYYLAQQVV